MPKQLVQLVKLLSLILLFPMVCVCQSDLLLHMKFDGNLIDESEYTNGTSDVFSNLTYSDSECSQALVIDNSGGNAVQIDHNAVDGLGDFTFVAFLKLYDFSNSNNLLSCANTFEDNEFIIGYNIVNPDYGYGWHLVIDGELFIYEFDDLMTDLEWHIVVFTRSGNVSNLFVDGNPIGNGIFVDSKSLDVSPQGFIIGQDQDCVGGCFQENQGWNGEIDELLIYDRVLTDDEISSLSCSQIVEICTDGIDNDGDGLIDCEDPDCSENGSDGCLICEEGESFADSLIYYSSGCPFEDPNPEGALGISDYSGATVDAEDFVFLGQGGVLELGFTNNLLTNSGDDSEDLHIFEVGPVVEGCFIALRPFNTLTEWQLIANNVQDINQDGFYEFGEISGSVSGLDIDSWVPNYQFGELLFDAVQIVDDNMDGDCTSQAPGADIDAICAIASISVEICTDGIDNDGDGLIDCEDPDCEEIGPGCEVCFGDGLSFADIVVDYSPECLEFLDPSLIDPNDALGIANHDTSENPPYGSGRVTLGEGGSITLGFTNNLITNSGDSDPDVWVFEVGIDVEGTELSFRPYDNITLMVLQTIGVPDVDSDGFYEFGAIGGSTASLDLDAVITGLNFGEIKFDAIKLTDDADFPCGAASGGADIDAVCALSSIPQELCDNDIDDDNDGLIDCDDPDLQSECCCIDPMPLDLGDDLELCQGEFVLLDAGVGFTSYLWQDGSQGQTIVANQEQYYIVNAIDSCENEVTDSIFVSVMELDTFYNMFSICEGDSILFNNEYYSEEGMYTFFENGDPCIDVIILEIETFGISMDTMEVILCEGDSIVINSEVYSMEGSYEQTLESSEMCDSLLTINIDVLETSDSHIHLTLCDGDEVSVNQETYSSSGEFTQVLENSNGCDSTIFIHIEDSQELLHIDFDDCDALIKDMENTSYIEFVHENSGELDCGTFEISNVYRLNPFVNKHSCTPGVDESVAMCISSLDSCDYDAGNERSIILEFNVYPDQGEYISFNCLQFYEKSPENFDWINGDSGLNNYPEYYGIRILKNQALVYEQSNIATTQDWSIQKYNFSEDTHFTVDDTTRFQIEILPYCLVGNGAEVAAWDIDELSISAKCSQGMFRVIAGNVICESGELINNVRVISEGETPENTKIEFVDSHGGYAFADNPMYEEYVVSAFKNDDSRNGVTTLDLVLIQRHVLGLQKLDSPYKLLAADINNDERITVTDLLQLRKLILGLYDEFPENTSWTFFDKYMTITNDNVWNVEEDLVVGNLTDNMTNQDFIGVKVGDVNGSYVNDESKTKSTSGRNIDFVGLEMIENHLENGTKLYQFFVKEDLDLLGLQLALDLNGAKLVSINGLAFEIASQNYHVKEDNLYMSWNSDVLINIHHDSPLFELVLSEVNDKPKIFSAEKAFNSEMYLGPSLSRKQILLSELNGSESFIVYQNIPNPFADYTAISYEGNVNSEVILNVFDLNGQKVLERRNITKSGINSFMIDRSDFNGANGIFYYQISMGEATLSKKMILMP